MGSAVVNGKKILTLKQNALYIDLSRSSKTLLRGFRWPVFICINININEANIIALKLRA
jgi:hypothetical protein